MLDKLAAIAGKLYVRLKAPDIMPKGTKSGNGRSNKNKQQYNTYKIKHNNTLFP